jgi:lysophospholipase L1-like esterase
MNIYLLQAIYILSGVVLLPAMPFLFLQGQYVRRKIGVLPDAQGEKRGVSGEGDETVKLLVIGESTVAGLGARTHENALAGQFSRFLSSKINKKVEWHVIGKNGVTAKKTMELLVPQIPEDEKFDYIMLGVGGNDVLKLSSPRKWRRDATDLINFMREKYPEAVMFMTNAPAVHLSPVLPQPIKFLLGNLSKLHDRNSQEFIPKMKVFYFHRPDEVTEGFFADGIHPSEKGYADWSKRMIEFFEQKYGW